ncbi:TolC family protein [Pseudomonas asplenii]|uniref:TolC family protein n=1 Tax=Pseudomonas asplenii TaxID=53407 RepID=UPI0006B53CCD|nr:outer membrane protein [Pseudomonas fuscovaginae]
MVDFRQPRKAGLDLADDCLVYRLTTLAWSAYQYTQYEVSYGHLAQSQNNRSYSVQLVQPLLHWQNWIAYQQGHLQQLLADAQLEKEHQALILRLAQAYFAVLAAKDVVESVEQLRIASSFQRDSARKRYELGGATIIDVQAAQASSDIEGNTDFNSNTQDRISPTSVPLIEPAHVMSLPKGQAFALIEGANLWKIRMPLPAHDPDDCMPRDLQTLAANMRKRYVDGGGELWVGSGSRGSSHFHGHTDQQLLPTQRQTRQLPFP